MSQLGDCVRISTPIRLPKCGQSGVGGPVLLNMQQCGVANFGGNAGDDAITYLVLA